jgi:hypothetical protein
VSEKLLNFAEAAASHPDFAHELPMFVAEVRRMFTPEELRTHLAVLVPRVEAAAIADAEPDEDTSRDRVRQRGGICGVVEVVTDHAAMVAIVVGTASMVGGMSSAMASVCM